MKEKAYRCTMTRFSGTNTIHIVYVKSNWHDDGAGPKLLSHMGMWSWHRCKPTAAAVCCGLPLPARVVIVSADRGKSAGRKLIWHLQNEVALNQRSS